MSHFYVISPVGADPEFAAKRAIIAAAAGSFGVTPLFPLDRQPGVAIERAGEDILTAMFVFADLTYERPSCYFELGLAEATGVDVSIVARTGTPIHQVGYASHVNFYRDLHDYERLVRELLQTKLSPAAPAPLRHARG